MARDQDIKRLNDELDKILVIEKHNLIQRPEWGTIKFESAKRDIDRIYDVINELKILPTESLTDDVINSITSEITNVKTSIELINKFTIEESNPPHTRDQLVSTIHTRADSLVRVASPWIPYLAYKKGDVAKNITLLTQKMADAQTLLDSTKNSIAEKGKEIDGIITAAREASASVGVAVFTHDFQNESSTLNTRSKTWLIWTGILSIITLLSAAAMWVFIEEGLSQTVLWQKLTTKLAILALLISATAWCGKIYKSLMHQSLSYRFRALALQTFQAFYKSGSNDVTKDAVLVQTTKAIYSDTGTGLIEGPKSSDGDIKLMEIVKSVIPSGKSNQ